jgi:two-component system, chemotaxis family, CheB/CheR fusion protein
MNRHLNGDVRMAVRAMQAGALDFIEKPARSHDLLLSIDRASEAMKEKSRLTTLHERAVARVATLTSRQRQIMDLVLARHPSKNIAADLRISQRTVENHRTQIMKKMGVTSIPALIRLSIAAA